MAQHSLSRTELIIGKESLEKLKDSRVAILGIGGVGSFAAEALARGGIGNLILVDDDTVCLTNINRQVIADFNSINRPKVDVMRERVLAINPKCEVEVHRTFVTEANLQEILSGAVDYVIDAIDTVSTKIALAVWCEKNDVKLISSMGTGNKLDPTKFEITDIYNTRICPLAKVMRRELKKRNVKKLRVLFSSEFPIKPESSHMNACRDNCVCGEGSSRKCAIKRQTPGSISFVPPVAGMIIAGDVIKEIIRRN
jgi:tRNA A37 threonylcarbamoyladenosine dehydratase